MSSSGSRETMRRPGEGRFGLWFHSHNPALHEGSGNSSNINSTANSNTTGTSRRRRGPGWKKALAAATLAGLGYAGGLHSRTQHAQHPDSQLVSKHPVSQPTQSLSGLVPIEPYQPRRRNKRNERNTPAPPHDANSTALVPYTGTGLNTRHLASIKPKSTRALTAVITGQNNQNNKNNQNNQNKKNNRTRKNKKDDTKATGQTGQPGRAGHVARALAVLGVGYGMHQFLTRKKNAEHAQEKRDAQAYLRELMEQHTRNSETKNRFHASNLAARNAQHALNASEKNREHASLLESALAARNAQHASRLAEMSNHYAKGRAFQRTMHRMNLAAKNKEHAAALATALAAKNAQRNLNVKERNAVHASALAAALAAKNKEHADIIKELRAQSLSLLQKENTPSNTQEKSKANNNSQTPASTPTSTPAQRVQGPPPPPPPQRVWKFANTEYDDVIKTLFPQQTLKRKVKPTAAEILRNEVIDILKAHHANDRVLEDKKFRDTLDFLFSKWKEETPDEFKDKFAAIMFHYFLGNSHLGFKHITTNANGKVIYKPETRRVMGLIQSVLDHLKYGTYTAAQLNNAATRQANLNIMKPHIQWELEQIRAEYKALLDETKKNAHILHVFFQEQSPPQKRTRIASNSKEFDKVVNILRKDPDITKGTKVYDKTLRAHFRTMSKARNVDYPAGPVRDAALFFKGFKINPFEHLSNEYVVLQHILAKMSEEGLKPSLSELGFTRFRTAQRIARKNLHEYGTYI